MAPPYFEKWHTTYFKKVPPSKLRYLLDLSKSAILSSGEHCSTTARTHEYVLLQCTTNRIDFPSCDGCDSRLHSKNKYHPLEQHAIACQVSRALHLQNGKHDTLLNRCTVQNFLHNVIPHSMNEIVHVFHNAFFLGDRFFFVPALTPPGLGAKTLEF